MIITLEDYIDENRIHIINMIKSVSWTDETKLDDETISLWILNDKNLFEEAKAEGVGI